MSVTNGYIDVEVLKTTLKVPASRDETALETAIEAASRAIDAETERRYWLDDEPATPKVFRPRLGCEVEIDDFDPATVPVIKTDDDDDGVFETTWAASDYELEPENPLAGYPLYRIVAVGRDFPTHGRRKQLQVTARWGWPSVPAAIVKACTLLAIDLHKSDTSPFGVAGWGDLGVLRVRENPTVRSLIQPFSRRHFIA